MQKIKKTNNSLLESQFIRLIILVAVTISITFMIYPNLVIKRYNYVLGDVSERGIKAPIDFLVENKDATENSRRQAYNNVLTVYDYDDTLVHKIVQRVNEVFFDIRNYIHSLKNSKDITSGKSEAITPPNQTTSSDLKTTDLIGLAEAIPLPLSQSKQSSGMTESKLKQILRQRKADFEKKLGISITEVHFNTLIQNEFSDTIEHLIVKILLNVLMKGVVSNKELLLQERDKGIVLKTIASQQERIIQDVRQYYDLDQAKAMVWIIGQPMLKEHRYDIISLVVDFVQALIQPNITMNKRETEIRREQSVQAIKPVLFQIKAGEMLLREGERIYEEQLLKLEALHSTEKKEKVYFKSVGLAILIGSVLMLLHLLSFGRVTHDPIDYNKNLLFMALILILFVFLTEISVSMAKSINQSGAYTVSLASIILGIPVAAGAMTICLFLGIHKAIPFALMTALCAAILNQNKVEIFIYFFLNSAMGAYWVRRCRERNVFIKAGVKMGLLNIIIVSAIRAYDTEVFLSNIVWDWIFGYIGGLSSGIVTAGITPLMEITFSYTTDIKLLELANLDRPLLHRLMLEAPGTYHHSVIVGSLVEAAASEIDANPLLGKVCGYYHDIGKMKNPLYYIENQARGFNRHDKLAPSMSSLIIISHVKHGVEMAKKHKLGKSIIDTIQQHHGSSMITYFYEKAKQIKGESTVNEDDFRYPGPKPQTREAGLVMLADVVEAASRVLENPTPARIQGLVQKLINKIFSDGQLDNCELTLKDLHNIAKSFNKILNGIHHHRIEYIDSSTKTNGKGKPKNGSPDRKSTKSPSDRSSDHSNPSNEGLKRLGLS